jgi:hypothetical protein
LISLKHASSLEKIEESVMKIRVLAVLSLACTLGAAPLAMAHALTAPGSPSSQNEGQGATTGLGSSHRFPSVAAATNHCGAGDPVVWSDGSHLSYLPQGAPGYGQGSSGYGFYACKSEADGAGFRQGQ